MKAAVRGTQGEPEADVAIMAAAVADYRPAAVDAKKIKKGNMAPTLTLVENEDVLKSLGQNGREARHVMLVGFAVETGTPQELVAEARAKLGRKGADIIVGNRADDAFDKDTNQVWIVSADEEPIHIQTSTKKVVARSILDQVALRLRRHATRELTH
jgi:phosphopantothenoylcysteine decarboxylase/phosphopantothenate--cysteine ligase